MEILELVVLEEGIDPAEISVLGLCCIQGFAWYRG